MRQSRHTLYNETYQSEATEYRNYLLLLGYADETCQSRYLYLKEFFNWLEEIGIYQLQHITAVEISNFYEYIENRQSTRTKEKLKLKSVYDIMRCVQTFLGYALDMGKLKTNPASHLKFSYPDEEVERKIITQEEIQQLYGATQTEQEKAILHIAYGCGLRVQEISQLNKEDVRLTENLVIVQKGKNSKRRLVPINEKVSQELNFFLSSEEVLKENGKAVFTHSKGGRMQQWTLNKLLKKLVLRTDFGKELSSEELNKIGIHSLRHSIATHLLQNGMKLEQVQQFLGHSHIESTEVYTHISQDQINELER
jgi:integrase/recombinase XerD